MVKRWKDEIVLGVVVLGCAIFGGYFGAKMAQIDSPKAPVTYERWETFGSLPASPELVSPACESPAPVIVIVVNETPTAKGHRLLNPIQKHVNFI